MRVLHAGDADHRARSDPARTRRVEAEIRKGLAGNICRCTGYTNIVTAIAAAAADLAGEADGDSRAHEATGMTQAATDHRAGVGAALLRKEDARHLAGRGQFVADVKLPNTQEVAFVRSPHAHARIKGIAIPPDADGRSSPPRTCRALPRCAPSAGDRLQGLGISAAGTEKVRFVGEVIAACIAPTRAEAEDLAASVTVEYDVLPAVIDAAAALGKTPSLVHEGWSNNLFIEREFRAATSMRWRAPPRWSCAGPTG